MPREAAEAQPAVRSLARDWLAVFALAIVVIYFAHLYPQVQRGIDFADFYAAARMVSQGQGHQLYVPAAQDEYLARYAGRTGTYFIHPPFETLMYLPFAIFTPSRAYMLWCAFNAVLAIAVARLLDHHLSLRWSWLVVLPLSLLFVPLLLNFLQGQDSLLLLFLLTSAFVALQERREYVAGCLLACGLIKFHLTLPAAIPFLFISPRKVFGGFFLGAATLWLISLEICGWAGLAAYPGFLRQLSNLPLAGIHDTAMANLRGLFGVLLPHSGEIAYYLTMLSSILVLGLVVYASRLTLRKGGATGLLFALSVLAAILAGYHLSPHDLTILLLPVALIAHHLLTTEQVPRRTKILLLLMAGIVLFPGTHLFLLHVHVYSYLCLPLIALFALTYAETLRVSART